jgi:hypothetical protein
LQRNNPAPKLCRNGVRQGRPTNRSLVRQLLGSARTDGRPSPWSARAITEHENEMSFSSSGMNQRMSSPRVARSEFLAFDTTLADWLQLVRAEYLEIPDLQLTQEQVRQLWDLDADTCETLLDELVGAQFLKRTHAGMYTRADES